MNKIKFSHTYCKFHGQTKAILIDVKEINANDLNDDLVEYDTKYIPTTLACECELHTDFDGDIEHCHYPLPKGKLVILTCIGNKHIPFCTIRTAKGRYGDKYKYYTEKLGQWFDVVIESEG